VRKRFPTANELAYDYKTFVVIGYSAPDRGIDAIVALAARSTGVSLYFNQGPKVPDPKGILMGSGKRTRFIQLENGQSVEASRRGSVPRRRDGAGDVPVSGGGERQARHHVERREEAAAPEGDEVTADAT